MTGPEVGRRERLQAAWTMHPYSVTLAAVLAPVGLLAVVKGDEVSRALSDLGAGVVSRVMGALLLAGGVLVLTSVFRRGAVLEAAGLTLLATGCGIYGAGVILGLGWGGMVAGPIALAVAAASARRVQILLRVACPGE